MRTPPGLESLIDQGVIDRVVRPLMSGKEAQVYLVESDGEERVAKVYKDAAHRSFKHRADYTEGRRGRNSRDQRAIAKGSKHGKAEEELAWRSAEVDTIYRLQEVGVRVPVPYYFLEGVLVMELVKDADGHPAPRLAEVAMDADAAHRVFKQLLREVVKMLCAGVVHGDLSDFNVLMGAAGPVLIDFPQAVNAAGNQNAREILLRDTENLQRFLADHDPTERATKHGAEMWDKYARGELRPDSVLTGVHRGSEARVDLAGVIAELRADERDELRRRAGRG